MIFALRESFWGASDLPNEMPLRNEFYLPLVAKPGAAPQIAGYDIFPADNIWNTAVDDLPIHPNSANHINTIGAGRSLHPNSSHYLCC